jgi:hypothetical protein
MLLVDRMIVSPRAFLGGGRVLRVATLAARAPGSLRAAIEAPRALHFAVAGRFIDSEAEGGGR